MGKPQSEILHYVPSCCSYIPPFHLKSVNKYKQLFYQQGQSSYIKVHLFQLLHLHISVNMAVVKKFKFHNSSFSWWRSVAHPVEKSTIWNVLFIIITIAIITIIFITIIIIAITIIITTTTIIIIIINIIIILTFLFCVF